MYLSASKVRGYSSGRRTDICCVCGHGLQITYAGGATSPLRGQGPCTRSVTLTSGERITGVSGSDL
jgi:hypothetical protein